MLYIGMEKDPFSIPVIEDNQGFYISKAQMEHFLLRPNALDELDKYWARDDSGDFASFAFSCKIYNAIRDICKDNPTACEMIWDDENSEFVFLYPENSDIHHAIESIIGSDDGYA